jgi:hypothetical protein
MPFAAANATKTVPNTQRLIHISNSLIPVKSLTNGIVDIAWLTFIEAMQNVPEDIVAVLKPHRDTDQPR